MRNIFFISYYLFATINTIMIFSPSEHPECDLEGGKRLVQIITCVTNFLIPALLFFPRETLIPYVIIFSLNVFNIIYFITTPTFVYCILIYDYNFIINFIVNAITFVWLLVFICEIRRSKPLQNYSLTALDPEKQSLDLAPPDYRSVMQEVAGSGTNIQ